MAAAELRGARYGHGCARRSGAGARPGSPVRARGRSAGGWWSSQAAAADLNSSGAGFLPRPVPGQRSGMEGSRPRLPLSRPEALPRSSGRTLSPGALGFPCGTDRGPAVPQGPGLSRLSPPAPGRSCSFFLFPCGAASGTLQKLSLPRLLAQKCGKKLAKGEGC